MHWSSPDQNCAQSASNYLRAMITELKVKEPEEKTDPEAEALTTLVGIFAPARADKSTYSVDHKGDTYVVEVSTADIYNSKPQPVIELPRGECFKDGTMCAHCGHEEFILSKPAPEVVPGWVSAVDEEMVGAHIGVANLSDSYETAKAKLSSLIDWHVTLEADMEKYKSGEKPVATMIFPTHSPEKPFVALGDCSKYYHDAAMCAPLTYSVKSNTLHNYSFELPEGDARTVRVVYALRSVVDGVMTHSLCIAVKPEQTEANGQEIAYLKKGIENLARESQGFSSDFLEERRKLITLNNASKKALEMLKEVKSAVAKSYSISEYDELEDVIVELDIAIKKVS